MAEEIVIGKLILDTKDLESSMASSKKAIIDLENEQKKLKKDTENLSGANNEQLQSFVDNELQLKKIKAEYSANQKSVLELTKAQTGLDAALKINISTQEQAKKNTADLTAARQKIDATTVDGAKAIANINTKIDQNNKFITANGSAQEKAANISGNYRQKIFDLGDSFGGASQKATGFVQGIYGMVKASLAFIATPIGLIIALIGAALLIVVSVFKTFQPLVDKVEQGMAALGAVLNVVKNTIVALITGTKSLGEAFSGLGGDMSKAANEAAALTKANQDLEDSMKAQEVTTSRNRAEINKLNVSLKNRTLTEQERLKISDEIIAKEGVDFKQRKSLVDQEVVNARKAIEQKAQFTDKEKKLLKETGDATKLLAESRGGNYDAEFDALNKARIKAIALEDENTTNLEKQYVKRDKLQDDAATKAEAASAKQKASSDKANAQNLKNAQNAIDILKSESNARNLDAAERLSLAQKIFDAENGLAEKSSTGSDLQKQLLTNRQNLSSAVLAIADEQINKEIEAQKLSVEQTKAVNAELYDSQSQSANDLAKAQILLLDKRLLSEKEYAEEVKKINLAKNESLTVIQTNFDEAEKIRLETAAANQKALEDVIFQIKLQDITDRDATEQEIKRALIDVNNAEELRLLQEKLDKEKEVYGISKEQIAFLDDKYRKDKELSDKKYATATKSIDKQVNAQKRAETERTVSNGLAAAGELFEGSKAVAVATALFNTYQGITAELATKAITPYEIGLKVANVAFVAASGFAAVKNILKTNKGSGGGGDSGGGGSRTTSGTGSFVNTAQTETVARATDRPTEQNTIVTPPVLILETLQEKQNNLAVKITSG